jgi:chemotaxis protein CheD
MTQIVVGIADCQISDKPDGILATFALGSCLAIAVHDPVAGVAGLLHFMLPESALDSNKALRNPFMFADTGVPLLFRKSFERGADRKRLIVHLAGGARMLDDEGVFNIGKRNYLAAKKLLWKNGIIINGEAVGGIVSRTVRLEVATGRFWMREGAIGERDITARPQPAKGVLHAV